MIELKVRWFAAYRELTGIENETCITDARTPAELFDEMTRTHDLLAGRTKALVAINDEMADWTSDLSHGDEVLFFPPVAGG